MNVRIATGHVDDAVATSAIRVDGRSSAVASVGLLHRSQTGADETECIRGKALEQSGAFYFGIATLCCHREVELVDGARA